MIRFRSFRSRLLALILGLAAISQLTGIVVVDRILERHAREEIAHQLEQAAFQFSDAVSRTNAALTQGAEAVRSDVGLRETLRATEDEATLRSALESIQGRFNAGRVALLSLDGDVLAETPEGVAGASAYLPLFEEADFSDDARSTGYGQIGDQLYSLAVVGLRAPQVIAWIVIGFPIDQAFIDNLRNTTDAEITLLHDGTTLAGTMTDDPSDENLIEEEIALELPEGPPATIRLTYSLDEKLASARKLEGVLAGVGLGTLALAAFLAVGVARSVSQPVRQLAAHTRVIAGGDYESQLHLKSADEFGQLADSFNAMSAGLAERDKVRDLLDKNVSPEIAAQLLRDGAALGGEEREATILFADLRGFTTLSEHQTPHDVLALLNRYFDGMSRAIEAHGGVIDKFIGDEIMALFGAPVAQDDAADRALEAALAMQAALAELNAELAQEGRPPLAIGIGINTARVVAGNIGSHRRLNYSVIGDGVNVAARLQTLTRNADHRADIILSASTREATRREHHFRTLGSVSVKGRREPVVIFALEA